MDLIYTDQGRTELGVIQNFNVDFDTTGNMDFQLTVGIQNNLLQGGFYWYIEGTEYGGRVDSYKVLTASNEIQYTGRNFRGILNTKVIEPPSGEDYKILSGTMSEVASTLISDARLGDLFVVDECDVEVNKYKFNRYIKTYDGLNALCVAYGLVPSFKVQDGMVHIAFGKATDYSDENEYTQDDLSFTITKTYANVNHLICLGQGDMKDRTVCHLYADADGNISETQSLFGQDEITEIYENTNAEDLAELKQEGITRLSELKNKDSFEVTASNLDLKIGDIIGGIERVTNTYVAREIVNIIAKIDDYKVDLEYKVGEDEAKRATSFGVSSGGSTSTYILPVATTEVLGGVKQGENVTIADDGTITVEVDSALSATSTKPVQNKIVNSALEQKQPKLGYIPIQQSGGAGQLNNNKIYIGWSGSRLKAQVDKTDLGEFVFQNHMTSTGKNTITMVSNSNYKLNGVNGTHFYWYRIGNIAFVQINMLVISPIENTMSAVFASGVPKAKYDNALFATSGQTSSTISSPTLHIRTDGKITAFGGTTNYFYAHCVYECVD